MRRDPSYNVPGSLQARTSALSRSEEAKGNMQISGTQQAPT